VDKIKGKVVELLKGYEMDYEDVDFEGTVAAFLDDMKRGLEGGKSTLEMIPTYIETDKEIPVNKSVVAIDAGGTNFRVGRIHFDEKRKPVIEDLRSHPMPGVKEEVSKEKFFEVMAGYIKDLVGNNDGIGFCFSYPTEIYPNKDGRAILLCKEIKAKQVEGQMVGENLIRALSAMGIKGNKHIVILNDTVATLLAGKGSFDREFGGYIGFILGTGTNCCYVEKNSNIKKKKDLDLSKGQIINTESGGFGRCRRGKIDMLLDKTTLDPGVHQFEKMISGAYLGALCLGVIKQGVEDGLFTSAAAEGLRNIERLETKDINDFLYYPTKGNNPLASALRRGEKTDAAATYFLIDRIVRRAAKLTAINLSAMAIKSDTGTDPTRPICIVAEGTTFHQLKTLKSGVEYYLRGHLEDKCGIYTDIVSVDNATLIGAAIAGLTN
jgi:hexokinase